MPYATNRYPRQTHSIHWSCVCTAAWRQFPLSWPPTRILIHKERPGQAPEAFHPLPPLPSLTGNGVCADQKEETMADRSQAVQQPPLELNSLVEWASQAQGTTKTKTGGIAQIVQPGELPDRERFPSLYTGAGVGSPRKAVSYVVVVGKEGNKGKAYWPLAQKLKPVSPEQ